MQNQDIDCALTQRKSSTLRLQLKGKAYETKIPNVPSWQLFLGARRFDWQARDPSHQRQDDRASSCAIIAAGLASFCIFVTTSKRRRIARGVGRAFASCREISDSMLSQAGCDVLVAHTGKEGMRLATTPFNILLPPPMQIKK
jgi:hypothetical protein